MKFKECFTIDDHKYNRAPKGIIRKLLELYFSQRYSMSVYLRLTEYFYGKYQKGNNVMNLLLAKYFRRKNECANQFEHGYIHNIAPGTLFHHTGVTINDNITIDRNVQIFKNITFALTDGKTCHIGEGSVVFSHVIILGKNIGKNCVIGAGSVVIDDVPDNSIVVGNPARVIKQCENAHDFLEFR